MKLMSVVKSALRPKSIGFLVFFFFHVAGYTQGKMIKGKVTQSVNNEALFSAVVVVQGTEWGAVTNDSGYFVISNVLPGLYNVVCQYTGYRTETVFEVEVSAARSPFLEFSMTQEAVQGDKLEVRGSAIVNRDEAPLSVREIGPNEIKRNPGGNRDISRVIRSLPGVAAIPSFRNDIIIRGGAAGENRFYIDGIEIPNINHFATQGASGGPVGMINVDLINQVQFFSGAFPANRGNALSSVLEFGFREAREDKAAVNLVVGTSDLGITYETPISKKSGLIVSARRSYLQGLFSVLGLPFLPTYNDVNFKWKWELNKRNKITVLGVGAVDQFELNLNSAEDTTSEDFQSNKYILDYLGVFEQWSYTGGVKWERLASNGMLTLVVSRNQLQNDNFKYYNNMEEWGKKYNYSSRETENKIRLERKFFWEGGWKLNVGAGAEDGIYSNDSWRDIYVNSLDSLVRYTANTEARLLKYGGYVQSSKVFGENRATLSVGLRADANTWGAQMKNPWDQLSPRVSLRYSLAPQWTFNANTGIYFQAPSYTAMAYQSAAGLYDNRNTIRYIRNRQVVAGIEYDFTQRNSLVTVEGFYKAYDHYPLSNQLGVSLANLGADFGVVGNESVTSAGLGRAYGMEFLYQQRLYKGFYGILAYTWVRSEFTNSQGVYAPSSWDSRHIVSFTGGKKFKNNWEIGGRFAFSGGLPYTPDNVQTSMQPTYWNYVGFAQTDWSKVNSLRNSSYHQLDVRVDKKYYFTKWTLDLFLDIQNVYNHSTSVKPALDVQRDAQGNPVHSDPSDPNSPYIPHVIPQTNGFLQPAIGLIIEL